MTSNDAHHNNVTSLACVADESTKAQAAFDALCGKYDFVPPQEADAIIALGGDGFMLHTLHDYVNSNKLIYGMNCGTVGFLMNAYREEGLLKTINDARPLELHPLHMTAVDKDGKEYHELAINEVSMLRQTSQTAHLKISVDGKARIEDLICDGVLVSTPAGSTAYNLSAHGPILPLRSNLLALTAISPFRPRRWSGALLSQHATVRIEVMEADKRPVSSVADFTEVRNVVSVEVKENRNKHITLLFDHGHSLEERIISEQFKT